MAATSAHAADKPSIGPPPAWVKLADDATPLPAPDQAAVKLLLEDQQLHFTGQGDSEYQESRVLIQTAQGLGAMGTVVLAWNPETESLTIHKLRILRGTQVIDILAKQTPTVVRRETNLEMAMLDGELTAVIQPEGLRVGDVLDIAFTQTRADPALAGRSQVVVGAPPGLPIGRLRLRAEWEAPKTVRWRATEGLEGVKLSRSGASSLVEFDARDLRPVHSPEGAPPRFNNLRQLEFSEFTAWAQVADLMRPLYLKAATLRADSPLKAEIARIKAASSDPHVQVEAALALVQDQVRYVFLGMNDGGLVPASADDTWTRRFGDCKAKTVLLLAILDALGVEAQPALVSTQLGDGLDQRLPNLNLFDHVMIRAVIGGKVYWLDGTRTGDTALERLRVPGFSWALPIGRANATLERLTPAPLDRPDVLTSLKIDATDGLDAPAPTHVESVFRGDAGLALKLKLDDIPAGDLDRSLKAYWNSVYDFITVTQASAAFDPKTGEERLVMDGVAKMAWDWDSGTRVRRYEADGAVLGWKADFKREPGPHVDAPYAVEFPSYAETRETIILPRKGVGFRVDGENIDQTLAARAFKRTAAIENGVFTLDASTRSLAPEFPASEATAAAAALTGLSRNDIYVRAPGDYVPTAKEVALLTADQPTDLNGYLRQADILLQAGKMAEAEADYNHALALDPRSAAAYSGLGWVYMNKPDLDQAATAFAKALSLDPKNVAALRGQGAIAEQAAHYGQAVTLFSRSLELDPDNVYALNHRAYDHRMLGQDDEFLDDTAEILRLSPDRLDLRVSRSEVLAVLKRGDEALAEVDLAIAAAPDQIYYQLVRAGTLYRLDRKPEAIKALDQLAATKPSASVYLTRANFRDKSDLTGRMADVQAALKLSPDAAQAIEMKALIQAESGDATAAAATLAPLLKKKPTDIYLRISRAVDYAKGHQPDLAVKDFAAAVPLAAKSAHELNEICWEEATANVGLSDALAACEAALKLAPNAPDALDSRAFVLLRLGRFDEAIAGYDAALRVAPNQAASLYGRGLARLRKGDAAEAQIDLAAARAAAAGIDAEFADYGMTP
jgi:tetratricopeptide (TPR) repeat protein